MKILHRDPDQPRSTRRCTSRAWRSSAEVALEIRDVGSRAELRLHLTNRVLPAKRPLINVRTPIELEYMQANVANCLQLAAGLNLGLLRDT
jgi:hypothetical protein